MVQHKANWGWRIVFSLLFFINAVEGLFIYETWPLFLTFFFGTLSSAALGILVVFPLYLFLPVLLSVDIILLFYYIKMCKPRGFWRVISFSCLASSFILLLLLIAMWSNSEKRKQDQKTYSQSEWKISQEFAISLMNDCKVTGVRDAGDDGILIFLEHASNAYVDTPSNDSAVVVGGNFAVLQDTFNKASVKCSNLDVEQANHNENISREDAIKLINECLTTGVLRNELTKRVELPLKPAAGYRTAYAAESDFEALIIAYKKLSNKCR